LGPIFFIYKNRNTKNDKILKYFDILKFYNKKENNFKDLYFSIFIYF